MNTITYPYIFFYFRHYCVKQSITDEHLYLLTDARVEALDRSLSQLNLFDKSNTDAVWKFVSDIQKDPTTTVLTTFSKIADKLIFRYFKIIRKLYVHTYCNQFHGNFEQVFEKIP